MDKRDDPPEEGSGKTPFLPILLYVLQFMGVLALLALAAHWLLKLF